MSPSTTNSRKPSPFRPESSEMKGDVNDLLRIITISVALLILLIPISMSGGPTYSAVNETVLETHANPAQAENLIQYSMPDTNLPIATGEISGYRGVAYVIEAESRLYFVDIVQDVTMDIALPVGDYDFGSGLIGNDVDLDGDTEFFLRNFDSTNWYILMVDINDGTVTEYLMPFIYPSVVEFGSFNGDSYPDLLIGNMNSRDNFLTFDVNGNATIGTFLVDGSYNYVVGHFASASEESIALVNLMGGSGYRNLTVVEADGTQVTNSILTSSVLDLVTFKFGAGLDELAVVLSNGYMGVYDGLTLGVIYSEYVDPVSSSTRFIVTGDFNVDTQDDLVVISRSAEMAYFRDGTDGASIRNVTNVYTFTSKNVGVGLMDNDSVEDVALGTTLGALGVIRGVDGNYANLEYLVDIQLSTSHQILNYDANFDGKDDVFCRIMGNLYLILSDTTAPSIAPLLIDPVHPTILDDYVTIKVDVNETSDIDYADIWMRPPGEVLWFQPQKEMYASHTEGVYYAFIGDLVPGNYEYYIEIQDSYFNIGELGNATHPQVFSVAGDFVWQVDKSSSDYVGRQFHQSDIGNLSDGSSVIYTIERPNGDDNLTLTQYSQFGVSLDSLKIAVPFKQVFNNFEVYTAMLDGDSILDIIVLDYYYDSVSILRYHAYHGSDFTLIGEGNCPYPYKDFEHIKVYDDDQDGNQELYLISATTPQAILKMDSNLSWSQAVLTHSTDYLFTPQDFNFVKSSTPGVSYIGIIRGSMQIDIYNAVTLAYDHSLDIDWSGYTNQDSIILESRFNATSGEGQFVAGINYWSGSDPTGRIFIFDSATTNINNTPVYEFLHQDLTYIHTYDTQGDESEELFVLRSSGVLSLFEPSSTLSPIWSTLVTGAQPLSSIVTDFDGDVEDEFLLFTDQDELLTSVSFDGMIEWTTQVGEVYNPYVIGDIDSIPGVEIGAYPFASVNSMILGAVRNLDTHYVLNVTASYSSIDIVQGTTFHVNVTVSNIYGETVTDATVYMSAHFVSPEGPATNTFGFYFDWPANNYKATPDATWSIGVVNLSIFIEHGFYHTYERLYVDAVTIRSDLHLSVQIPDLVIQGEGMTVEVLVQDNLGSPVRGATVSVTIEGVGQTATQSGPYYVVTIPEVDLEAGMHNVSAVATHTYGTGIGFNQETFTAQILTTDLLVATDFPTTINQDDLVSAWFNVTDPYGNPITNALVSLRSGPEGFTLIESTVVPGSYRFNHNITLGLGNHTFEIKVDKQFLFGPAVAQIEFDVLGNLEPNVFYETRVAGGSMFNVHVFVKDKYGPVFTGTSVTITINGTEYTQTNADGNPDYDFLVPANFLLGSNNFMINVTAAYGNAWFHNYLIRAYSDALGSTTVYPEGEWIVDQGEQTEFQVLLEDWLGRPVQGASITMFVKAVSYRLYAVGLGHYAANITTVGWAPGEYQYTVSVGHEDIVTGEPITGNITILGSLDVFIDYNPDTPMQGGPLTISISVADKYGNPVPSLAISVTMLNMPTMYAEETDQVGQYVVFIEHLPDTEGYGIKNISLGIQGQFIEPAELSGSFTLAVAPPHIEAMGVEAIGTFTGLSFLFSLLGMFLYFRLAPTLRKAGTTKDELEKSVKRMDRLYLLIVLVSAAGLVGSMGLYSIGDYGGALILTVVLLGSSVLLYGLWLYRDAVSAVMVKGSLNRKRMIAGLWHLVFVPVVIILILTYGAEINWFKAYMIDNAFVIGDLRIPAIMTTIFTAYLSSILVVVVNLYREVSSGLKKLKKMEDANTPASIMEDERDTMVSRYSSSIRIKFLMFLVIVGAAAVTTMDFLQNYELGIIVLMPVAFLVVIPFISSKIVKIINQATSIKIRKSDSDIESYED